MTTAGTPNEDTVLLQTAMQHIDSLHHTMTQSVAGFETLFHEPAPAAPADTHGAGALQDALAQFHQLTTDVSDALAQKLAHAVDGLHQNTAQAQTATQQHAQDWDQAHDGLNSSLTTLEHTTETIAEAALNTFGELQNSVEHASQSTQDMLNQFESASQTLQRSLADTVTASLNQAGTAFHDGISETLNSKVTEHLTSIFQNGEESLNNLAQTAEHITQNFGHEAEDALQHFGQDVVTGVKNALEQAAEHLAKDVMEMLTAFIATSIAESTAGAAITGAMSPILPEVIVVKEASEAIKDLISVFKAIGSLL